VAIDWGSIATTILDPMNIPPEIQMKATLPNNHGRYSVTGPGKLEDVTLNPYRSGWRFQELVFELARDLTRDYCAQASCEAPPHVLFPQLAAIVQRYLSEKVRPLRPAEIRDVFLAPYYGWVIEILQQKIMPDTSHGEVPEVPRYEQSRGPGSTADVDFWTSRDVREVLHSHVNYVVADTAKWEQSAAYVLDTHPLVDAFVKNAGLGFAIPYLHNGQPHDYVPDFIVRMKNADGWSAPGGTASPVHMILETKGFDPLREIKVQAAQRWVDAVNADRRYGRWDYVLVKSVSEIDRALRAPRRECTNHD
jgi:type III restriction enzyme